MKPSSLRLRLALLSSTLAGSVLVGFALLSGWLTYQAKLDRLDAQLLSSGMPMGRPHNGHLPPNPETSLAQRLGLADPQSVALLIVDRNGELRYQSPWWPETLPPTRLGAGRPDPSTRPGPGRMPLRLATVDHGTVGPITWRTPTGRWRVGGRVTPLGRVGIAISLQTLHQEMALLWRMYGLTIPGALVLIAGGAWWLSGRALQPIGHLSHTIAQVTAQGLHQRVPTTAVDQEFAPLITAFNAMLERLECSFHQASRFSGDAAHELKTPLAILQGELEQAMHQAEAGSPLQQTLGHLLDEVSRLSGIVRKLLLLSLADAGQIGLRRETIDLSGLITEQLEDLSLLAPDLTITTAVATDLSVKGDRDLLLQVIQNLLSNAIKYNLPQGWIQVQAAQHQGQVNLTITNAAQPLTPADQTRLFDRFYRGDPARTRRIDGLGLGLSLAREIARAHGGDVCLTAATDQAVSFRLSLPLA